MGKGRCWAFYEAPQGCLPWVAFPVPSLLVCTSPRCPGSPGFPAQLGASPLCLRPVSDRLAVRNQSPWPGRRGAEGPLCGPLRQLGTGAGRGGCCWQCLRELDSASARSLTVLHRSLSPANQPTFCCHKWRLVLSVSEQGRGHPCPTLFLMSKSLRAESPEAAWDLSPRVQWRLRVQGGGPDGFMPSRCPRPAPIGVHSPPCCVWQCPDRVGERGTGTDCLWGGLCVVSHEREAGRLGAEARASCQALGRDEFPVGFAPTGTTAGAR
ncbi:uncharacterized protein LOC117285517 [Fukomys damarensis]|uniref:uncharacterized protein LOC117285517 n=1 Tax=Fukomys damarensis TaxID=885580 RepID=UPI00145501FE|nr:uncharacterized protein LOC117285517 [Fukomys damarensis]